MPEIVYRAFISHSHADQRWARWLHRSLESFRPPRNLALGRSLRPIFLDRDEMAASSDLSDSIRAALRLAENLIVVCSPSVAQSHWVNEAVSTLFQLGRGDRGFCLFVSEVEASATTVFCLGTTKADR